MAVMDLAFAQTINTGQVLAQKPVAYVMVARYALFAVVADINKKEKMI